MRLPRHWRVVSLSLALLGGLSACAGGYGAGYGYYDDYDYDYYEPPGFFYGGWGPGYFVGPPRGHFPHGPRGPQGHAGPRPFRPAPPSRPVPSIPGGRR